jgi:hypothetical protein
MMLKTELHDTSAYTGVRKRATDDDREWFARHPARKFRLRYWIQGEHDRELTLSADQVHYTVCTLVVQIAPGVRVRQAFLLRPGLPPPETCPEGICARIWEQVKSLSERDELKGAS